MTDATRRNFLRYVGMVGGAGVMYQTMAAMGLAPGTAAPAFAAPRADDLQGKGKSVVILGGGIAGLTTAYELGKAGYKVTILEARMRPGGRNWTVRGGTEETDMRGITQRATFSKDQYMNAGPGRIPQHHITLDYCKELGVAIEPFTNQNADGYLFREGSSKLSNTPVRHRAAKADVYGYVSELLAKATDQGALDSYMSAADKENLISFLKSFGAIGNKVPGDAAASFKYTGTGRKGYSVAPGAGLEAGTPLAPAALSDVFASGVGNYFSFEFGWDQAMMMFQPVGGMDRIPYAFEAAIGKDKFVYGAQVLSMNNTAAGVSVEYTNPGGQAKMIEADFAVCTLPPHIAAKVPGNLPADVIDALKFASPSDAGKIGIEYSRRWWEEDHRIYGGITNTNIDLGNMWYPSTGFHGQRGTMVGYYNTGASARVYKELSPEKRLGRALDQGARIHGDVYRKDVAASFSVDWGSAAFSEGAWVGWPSQTDARYAKLLEPSGNIYFAGDHLSHAIAWQHGAMTSARAAVTSLHTRAAAMVAG
ncbi:flavin monoamine oxidase family protein [Pseudarthrobacter scleromae]|uniref:flavin monoamine oxidase family protein n=1 Tax=Pseudarthrobacter scleromae TaxID=158897 RepID=UPI00362BFFC1